MKKRYLLTIPKANELISTYKSQGYLINRLGEKIVPPNVKFRMRGYLNSGQMEEDFYYFDLSAFGASSNFKNTETNRFSFLTNFADTIKALKEHEGDLVDIDGTLIFRPAENQSEEPQVQSFLNDFVPVINDTEDFESEEESQDAEQLLSEEYQRNPKHKLRGDQLIDFLAKQIRLHNEERMKVLIIGPPGSQGVNDIEVDFKDRTACNGKKLSDFIEIEVVNKTLMPSRFDLDSSVEWFGMQKVEEEKKIEDTFYKNLSDEIKQIVDDYRSNNSGLDLLCICRGGGDANEIGRLNNLDLCKTVINLPVPVCAAIGHASDSYLWLKKFSDCSVITPTAFVNLLATIVNKAFPIRPEDNYSPR